jgi:crotonobetainyl-CoA:carnitine CoA-transferase CaiB-like acyl-CoA transferase
MTIEGDLDMGKLTGIKVIDLTVFLPGPMMTMMMADQGAEVWKPRQVIPRAIKRRSKTANLCGSAISIAERKASSLI